IKGSESKGKLSIDYYSKEDLEAIIEILRRG
ncbi:MAG: stage 0 sporulation protein J, partial [Tissierellia bacterium]|nr:stage 0 sporulation protein J [Tissierellia bacterium]